MCFAVNLYEMCHSVYLNTNKHLLQLFITSHDHRSQFIHLLGLILYIYDSLGLGLVPMGASIFSSNSYRTRPTLLLSAMEMYMSIS